MSEGSQSSLQVDWIRQLRHDLRTPVNHIVGFAELVMEEMDGAMAEQFEDQLERVVVHARDLTRRIDEVMQPDHLGEGEDQEDLSEQARQTLVPRVDGMIDDIKELCASANKAGAGESLQDLEVMQGAASRLRMRLLEPLFVEEAEKAAAASAAASTVASGKAPTVDQSTMLLADTEADPVWVKSEKRCRILIVDDNAQNRALLTRLLDKQGYRPVEAEDAKTGLAVLDRDPCELVLLDIMMPVMDGYQMLDVLQKSPVLSSIPVIMLTSINEVDSVVRCIQSGADDYLTKPINPVLLQNRIEKLLTQRRTHERLAQLGSYTLLNKVGEGAMAEVFLGRHELMKRPTAIKLLKDLSVQVTRFFEKEVQQTCRLSHPNTIAIHDYGRTPGGRFYYAMEFLDGIGLDDLVEQHGPLPPARVIHLLRQCCASLHEAHSYGLVHRDIKPGNIILCERGGRFDVAKVCDFGLVKDIDAGEEASGMLVGTPLYMSPESCQTPEEVDARSDLYALGALGYYLVCGRPPFMGRTIPNILMQQIKSTPRPLWQIMDTVPRDLERVLLACLAKDPAERPDGMAALGEALAQCEDVGGWSDADAADWWKTHLPERGQRDLLANLDAEAGLGRLAVDLD